MQHYFISCYFNPCGYKSRLKNTLEFLERYPNVICLEMAYGEEDFKIPNSIKFRRPTCIGWETNYLINQFIKHNRKTLASLTMIDSDLVLQPDFFELMTQKFKDYEDEMIFIQGFESAEEIYKDPMNMSSPIISIAKNFKFTGQFDTYFHTGYIYGYSKEFLEQINYHLPECLVLGGFDTVLWIALGCKPTLIKKLINNDTISKELLEFCGAINGSDIDYIDGCVKHKEHGNKDRRYNGRFALYSQMTSPERTSEIIENYWKLRAEDN